VGIIFHDSLPFFTVENKKAAAVKPPLFYLKCRELSVKKQIYEFVRKIISGFCSLRAIIIQKVLQTRFISL